MIQIIVYWVIALSLLLGGSAAAQWAMDTDEWYTFPVLGVSSILAVVGGLATIIAVVYWLIQFWMAS